MALDPLIGVLHPRRTSNTSQQSSSLRSALNWPISNDNSFDEANARFHETLSTPAQLYTKVGDAILKEVADWLDVEEREWHWASRRRRLHRLTAVHFPTQLSTPDAALADLSALAPMMGLGAEPSSALLYMTAIQLLASCYTLSLEPANSSLPAALYVDRSGEASFISSLRLHTQSRYSPAFGHQARSSSVAPAWPGFTSLPLEERIAEEVSRKRLMRKIEADVDRAESMEEFIRWSNDVPIDPEDLSGSQEKITDFIKWSDHVPTEPQELSRVFDWTNDVPVLQEQLSKRLSPSTTTEEQASEVDSRTSAREYAMRGTKVTGSWRKYHNLPCGTQHARSAGLSSPPRPPLHSAESAEYHTFMDAAKGNDGRGGQFVPVAAEYDELIPLPCARRNVRDAATVDSMKKPCRVPHSPKRTGSSRIP
ncbi:hypothetical protein BJ546DRAFT_952777 [Cryomyces antarcticus]